ncbi:MAG: PHP domain-containing protein [Candidatus Gastranaerophilales bacterium]|nr:PHP domain-containing protein [Candidatus Gastranaerophilales bacterium]
MSKVDFHMHSIYSDGSDSVDELLENIKQAGLKTFALTDHDTFDGCIEMSEKVSGDIKFIKGIELTCTLQGIKCHLLGYYIDLSCQELKNLIEKGKKLRRQKLDTRIDYLKNVWKIALTDDEKEWLYSRKSVVKTHLANILVKRGFADTNVNAMKKYLDACKTGNTRFDGEEAIAVLKNAGALIVWAHPLGGEGEVHISGKEFTEQLEVMKNHGVQGLECYYSRYNRQECEFLYGQAVKNNMYVSGGSDYHGSNKENIKIGQLNTENFDVDTDKFNI